MNATNFTEMVSKFKYSHEFRLSISIVYDFLLITSLIMNLFQLAVFIKGHKILKTMAFFIISWQMLFNNLIILSVVIIFMTSVIFTDTPVFSPQFYHILAFIQSFAYNGLLLFAFLLTLNRLTVFAFPKIGKFFFDGFQLYIIIILFWGLTGWMVTGIMESPCPIMANPEELGFGSSCISGNTNIYNYVGQYVATYIPVFMIVAYLLIYVEIKVGIFCNFGYCCNFGNLIKKHQNENHSKAEVKLLLQAALICSTFFIQNFCWTYLPHITTNISFAFKEELILVIIKLASTLLYSVDAIVIFSFNSMIQNVAISFFKSETDLVFITPINTRLVSHPVTMEMNPGRRISFVPALI